MVGKEELVRLIEDGDPEALLGAVRDPAVGNKLLRRIMARLYSTDPHIKWKAVAAMGVAAGEGGLSLDKVQERIKRFLWAMSDESGAVPYGIPEALGEVLASRPELLERYQPILVSYLVHEELVQTGPILAGAIWALGRTGGLDAEEAQRALPGFRSALESGEPDVCGAALWTLGRLDLVAELEHEIRRLTGDSGQVCLLIDGAITETTVGDLARRALDNS